MKQEWYCENCGTLGFVRMAKHIDAMAGLDKVRQSHASWSSQCKDSSRVRVRGPECSQTSWNQVTRRQEHRRRDAAINKLFRAAGKWAEVSGGSAVVASGPGIIRAGFGDREHTYQIVIDIMGKPPIAIKDLPPVKR